MCNSRLREWFVAASIVAAMGVQTASADNGQIYLNSTNPVSTSPASYRWEPSTADTGGWLMSWDDLGSTRGAVDLNALHAYTSYWTGVWTGAIEHRTPPGSNCFNNQPLIDTYTYWDSYRGQYALVALDECFAHSVWVQYSTDAQGASWNSMTMALAGQLAGPTSWDFPSIAVDPNSGRIVVGASQLTGGTNTGYWTAYSTDGGATWNGPYAVVTSGGSESRLVSSASGFHAFIIDKTNPSAFVLMHWQSADGQTWTRQADFSTYGMPLPSSPTDIVCATGVSCGQLSYAATPDATSSSGLGWVIAYPVNINGYNAINVSTELGGGVTINYSTDLFSSGITTSSSGDWYLTYQTYQGGDRVLPIQQGVVYRVPGSNPTYLGATIQSNIDVSQWFYLNYGADRCSDANPCFAAGDYFRPAMNQYTGASVPMIIGSASDLNDLDQSFIQDPPAANVPQFIPHIEPYIQGTNISSRAVITAAHLAHIAAGQTKFDASMLVYESLRRAGIIK